MCILDSIDSGSSTNRCSLGRFGGLNAIENKYLALTV